MNEKQVEELSQKVFRTICQRLCCRGSHKGYDGFRCFFCGKSTPTEHDNFCRACMTEIPAIISEGYYKVLQPIPSHLESPDYETPLNRASLINKIHHWYDKKFQHTKNFEYLKINVFDLIADFIMDTKFSTPAVNLPSVEILKNIIKDELSGIIDENTDELFFTDGAEFKSERIARIIYARLIKEPPCQN
jgi:hypothetical protein